MPSIPNRDSGRPGHDTSNRTRSSLLGANAINARGLEAVPAQPDGTHLKGPISISITPADEDIYSESLVVRSSNSNTQVRRKTGQSKLDTGAGAVDLNNSVEDLRDEASKIMSNKCNVLGLKPQKCHIPSKDLPLLASKERVKHTISPVPDDLTAWIAREAPRTFVITVLSIHDPGQRRAAMMAFYIHGFNDGKLPMNQLPSTIQHRLPSLSVCGEDEAHLHCFLDEVWTYGNLKAFYDQQWTLIPQKFLRNQFVYNIEKERILPFLQKKGTDGSGHFSIVRPARILTEYTDFRKDHGSKYVDIAIKTMQPNEDEYDVETEWAREADAHKALDRLEDEHIVQAIAAYKYQGDHCLLLEWADGGDLRSHWNSLERPNLTHEIILEYLEQLRGLTSALNKMHHISVHRRQSGNLLNVLAHAPDNRLGSSGTSTNNQTPNVTVDMPSPIQLATSAAAPVEIVVENHDDDDDRDVSKKQVDDAGKGPFHAHRRGTTIDNPDNENWRHGDIKPKNILRFSNGSSGLGTLKLADLGRAKKHLDATKLRTRREWDKWRTRPYEPPDLYIHHAADSMSRLFDVWSLACVFLEAIIFLLYGSEWLKYLEKIAAGEMEGQTPFWVRNKDSAEVSPLMIACMNHILTKDPECNGKAPSALGDLVMLVRDMMLKIELPPDTDSAIYIPGTRANTHIILEELDKIIKKSKEESNYLFTGNPRSDVEFPPKPARPVTTSSSSSNRERRFGQKLGVPGASNQAMSATRQARTYANRPNNTWKIEKDDKFALEICQQNPALYSASLPNDRKQALCEECRNLDATKPGDWPSRKVADLDGPCSLCIMLKACADSAGWDDDAVLGITAQKASLMLTVTGHPGVTEKYLRLCRSPIEATSGRAKPLSFIPQGLPLLPEIPSPETFTLLQRWLSDCDENHHGCATTKPNDRRPRRVLEVGLAEDQSYSRLVETCSLRDTPAGTFKYLALSHPWGKPTQDNQHFKTTKDTLAARMERIPDKQLPPTFRDAVQVARRLRVNYLWIDAICIVQATETDRGDFEEEASFMQDIFSSAYAVLAASSAVGMNSGFLHCGDQPPRRKRRAVKMNSEKSGCTIFVCDSPNDFEGDVLKSSLCTRAWAFQERALARRTIFFTNNQIYWECSAGITCESLCKLSNDTVAFMGDSNFPTYAVKQTRGAKIDLFRSLYSDFSRLLFSHNTDKPFAINGLEQRLLQEFNDICGAGVFGNHIGRCLLWTRAEEAERLEQIHFGLQLGQSHPPPTWSFMAHSGPIEYMDPPGRSTEWENLDIRLTGTATRSWLMAPEPLSFRAQAFEFTPNEGSGTDDSSIMYDDPTNIQSDDKCVIIGKRSDKRYILVVRSNGSSNTASEALYERVGAGYIPSAWISSKGSAVAIV